MPLALVDNGSNPCIAPTISQANAFLVSVGYIGPTGTYKLTPGQRATAVSLANTLSAYNSSGGTCSYESPPPTPPSACHRQLLAHRNTRTPC